MKLSASCQLNLVRKNYKLEMKSDKGYKRLSATQPVAIKYAGLVLTFQNQISDNEINVTAETLTDKNKPKGFIHYVDANNALPIKIKAYSQLFKSKDPESAPGGYWKDINQDSLEILDNAVVDKYYEKAINENLAAGRPSEFKPAPFLRAQFERTGYFCLDRKDSRVLGVPVFNKTIGLKQ